MGSILSQNPVEEEQLLERPWRVIPWGEKQALLHDIRNFRPPTGVTHLRILLYGPPAAGKSSFINTVSTVLRGQSAIPATAAALFGKSFTLQLRTHKIRVGRTDEYFPFVFNDLMGLEPSDGGIRVEDVIQVMKGHVRDGYKFHPGSSLSETDFQYYNPSPTFEDKVHLLVCVFSANTPELCPSVVKRIKTLREAARDLGIPHVALCPKIDLVSKEINSDVKNVFKLKSLHKKMEELSVEVGFEVNAFFPVRNHSDGVFEGNEDVDTLILSTLQHMLHYADDYAHEQRTSE